ncbi:TMEM8A [Cordylochernes scorpioides]|uniref:TMEM8A n=1 Tax=Cordylochernes scorpioides TaxID=51811 RepID=A0ABY6JZR2_9ARAC|nr:TMEM8A [Cordylochernes scorpioides]
MTKTMEVPISNQSPAGIANSQPNVTTRRFQPIRAIENAYQESLLHPYRSYKDVVIFHFSVPHQITRAIWQFVAFMDDPTCTQRNVYIHLRPGSYPVVAPDNASFPQHLVVPGEEQFSLHTLSHFQPREMAEFRLHNPLPGDWFAVAYVLDWDHDIKQQVAVHCPGGLWSPWPVPGLGLWSGSGGLLRSDYLQYSRWEG